MNTKKKEIMGWKNESTSRLERSFRLAGFSSLSKLEEEKYTSTGNNSDTKETN
jgi:hypothetical protein